MNCHISGKEAHLRKKKTRLEEKKAIQEDTPHPQKQHMRMFLQKKRNGCFKITAVYGQKNPAPPERSTGFLLPIKPESGKFRKFFRKSFHDCFRVGTV